MKCKVCKNEAVVSLRSHNAAFCETCFLKFFRRQIERGIHQAKLFSPGDKILVAISGGKDSLTLAQELQELDYDISALFIDLAIPGSSEIALEHARDFCAARKIPLLTVDLRREGMPIPLVKKSLKRPICSACGKIKRYWFNRFAVQNGFDVLATGHNLDDEIGRLFSNVLRWDSHYLGSQGPLLPAANGFCRKVKPLWRLTEFETANYSFIRGIESHWAPCPYSSGASFTALKKIFHDLELEMPGRKLDFYQGFLDRGKEFFSPSCQRAEEERCVKCGTPVYDKGLCGICKIRSLLESSVPNSSA